MGRKAKFSSEQIVQAALELAVEQGPTAVTVSAIAAKANAPVGSVYHRFASRDEILARVWLSTAESFQAGFIEALLGGNGLDAALFTPRWVRRRAQEAQILLRYRREELASATWPEEIRLRAEELRRELDTALGEFIRERFGGLSEERIQRTIFALIETPYAAVRRHLMEGNTPPAFVDTLIKESYHAIMGAQNENLQSS